MTVEELKAILEEIPNDCQVEIFDDDGDAVSVDSVQLTRIYKKDGYIRRKWLNGFI